MPPINCDRARIGQLFSNLVANAIAYSPAHTPVRVGARSSGGQFELTVTNSGDPIPADIMKRLFLPYRRGNTHPGKDGLGLDLFIASEIAQAHGGVLSATSFAQETCFTLRIPLSASEPEAKFLGQPSAPALDSPRALFR